MSRSGRRVVATMMIVTALAVTGCGGADGGDTAAPPAPAVTSAPESSGEPATPGPPAAGVPESLSFQAPTVDGGTLDAATLAGQPVAFWFWAAWCPRCAAAASDVKAVQEEYAGQAHVVGVAGLGSGEAGMREFIGTHELDGFPHLADDEGAVWRRFEVTTQEYFVLLDAAGTVVHSGPLGAAELRDELDALVEAG
jgi:peroxiredoxin